MSSSSQTSNAASIGAIILAASISRSDMIASRVTGYRLSPYREDRPDSRSTSPPRALRVSLTLCPDACLVHEIRAHHLAPVRDGRDFLLLEQNLRLLLHVGAEVLREARVHVHGGERLAERLLGHRVALGRVEPVDRVRDLVRVLLEVARHVEPRLEVGHHG